MHGHEQKFHFRMAESGKTGLESGLQSKSRLEYYKSDYLLLCCTVVLCSRPRYSCMHFQLDGAVLYYQLCTLFGFLQYDTVRYDTVYVRELES